MERLETMPAPYSPAGELERRLRLLGPSAPESDLIDYGLYLASKQLPANRVPGDQITDITRKLVEQREKRQQGNGAAFPLKHISTYRGDDIAIPWAIVNRPGYSGDSFV